MLATAKFKIGNLIPNEFDCTPTEPNQEQVQTQFEDTLASMLKLDISAASKNQDEFRSAPGDDRF